MDRFCMHPFSFIMPFTFSVWLVTVALALNKPASAIFDSTTSSRNSLETLLQNGIWMTRLSNQHMIPLLGFGAGNVARSHVGTLKIYLIDTAQESRNEELIAEGMLAGAERFSNNDNVKPEIHVMTKVWYTNLGYNHTRVAVEDSLEAWRDALTSDMVDVKLHIQLHWPRCFDSIEWMDCENEEPNLEEKLKQVGPDPRQDPSNSIKGNWTCLEDLYLSAKLPIASIGVANFALADLKELNEYARVQPHTLQINLWSVLKDPMLIEYCHRHHIHVQVYNVLQSAMGSLQHIAKAVRSMKMTPGQAVLSWLAAQQFSVFPRTSKMGRLSENSGTTIASLPPLSPEQMEHIGAALRQGFGEDYIPRAEELPVNQSADLLSWLLTATFLIFFGTATGAFFLSSPPKTLKLKRNAGRKKHSKQQKNKKSEEKRDVLNTGWSFVYLWRLVTLSFVGHPYSEKVH